MSKLKAKCQNSKLNQRGQALVMIMLISVIVMIAVVSATTLVISELKKNTALTLGTSEYHTAYGALENAFMQLLRNPNYSGETVTLESSTCYITATTGLTKTVVARCTNGAYVRKISATVTFADGLMNVTGISEVP